MEWVAIGLTAVIAVANFAVMAYRGILRGQKGAETRIGQHETEVDRRMDGLTERVSVVEENIRGVPARLNALETAMGKLADRESLGKIHARMDDFGGLLHELKGGHDVVYSLMKMVTQEAFSKRIS